ncbi:hypothetical protein KJ863_04185 [Patescibacteria group bacterium]|nr:hypothetical protein [Candidatus Falkowbacteria bacterium]MBU3906571.1 hypothetical protein [Patescibacteria group bacterium]MCG2697655.1 hypothetical protein [Candidatus Parcubacteria bacterium]MBU4015775.1 hypothetical protein [Patescibacteria group bacterium]MBU4073278.1 hypothetical protein [Patescibacteria group bacterium]
MAIFHKCDKCGKNVKGEVIKFSVDDINKRFFDNWMNRFEFCEECAKPLAGLIKKFLLNKKNKK